MNGALGQTRLAAGAHAH